MNLMGKISTRSGKQVTCYRLLALEEQGMSKVCGLPFTMLYENSYSQFPSSEEEDCSRFPSAQWDC